MNINESQKWQDVHASQIGIHFVISFPGYGDEIRVKTDDIIETYSPSF